METRANYILIGAFTLLAILGTLGFFIWLASVQIDRQYATYGILFDDVSGLDPSGDVLFNGISVGKVIGLRIDDQNPSKVFTTVEIDAATPVRADTVAQLQSQGVTGVAYISLSGGTPGAAMLTGTDERPPIIPSRRSTIQSLVEDAPDLLVDVSQLLKQFQTLTGPENQQYVASILRNLDASSARLDQALSDFSAITSTVSDATAQIGKFTERLDGISAGVTTTLEKADAALASAQRAFDSADTALASSKGAIDRVEGTFTEAETILRTQVPDMLAGARQAIAQANATIADLQKKSGDTIDGFGQTADLLNARLTELEQSMKEANTAFVAVTTASNSFDTLVAGDGTLLVTDARAVLVDAKSAISRIDALVQTDAPALVADVRAAVATAAAAVEQVASDLTGLSGRLDPLASDAAETLASARGLMTRAQSSLEVMDTTLSGADGALTSAQAAFDAATGVMDTDLAPVLEEIRAASARISTAVEEVTRDAPAITAELRGVISRADTIAAQVQAAVAASAPGIGDFAQRGLPELTRLGTEARSLVTTLNSLVRRIESNPARFLLDNRVPEYRR